MKMDCNNNDGASTLGTNYVYQTLQQQPMNSTINGMMNNSPIGSNMQQQSITVYDKKQQYDLSTSNNSVYLNGHNSITPPINNNLPNNIPSMPTNLSNSGHAAYNQQYNAHPPISPAASTTPNRINQQYPDYNNSFNGSPYYNSYDRNLNYNQINHLNSVNHPVNHASINPQINQVQSKDNKQIQMPYLPNDQQGNTTSTNQIYNPHHSNPQINNLHHVPSPQTSLQATHHQTQPQSSPVVVQQQHLPVVSNNQPPQHHHSNQTLRPHGNINHHSINNANLNNYPPQTYHQQHVNQFNNSNSLPNSNNPVNSNPSTNYQSGYDQNYYNYGHNNEQWRFQQQISKTANNSPSLIGQSSSSNPQLQTNLNQTSIPSDQKVIPNLNNNGSNLNNSANLSQPYANMHISGNNPMNNSMNNSLNNSPMTPNSTPINQQLTPNHQFHPNQTSTQSTNYMSMNNVGSCNYYSSNPVDNHHVQKNHQPQQYLASPHHQSQHNPNIPIQQNQQYHPSQIQQIPSPQLTILQNTNTSTNNDSKKFTTQKQKAPSLKSNSNNSSLSALDETLDSVINGTIKQKRRRGKGKATKDKIKKEAKATSAYALFFKKVQEEIKRKSPKMAFGDISKTVAYQWGLLPEEAKQSYRSITDKERKFKLEELAKEKAMKVVGEPESLDHNFCKIKKEENNF